MFASDTPPVLVLPDIRRPGAAAAAGAPVACIKAARQKRRAAALASSYARRRMTANSLRLFLLAAMVLGLGAITEQITTSQLQHIQQQDRQLQSLYRRFWQ